MKSHGVVSSPVSSPADPTRRETATFFTRENFRRHYEEAFESTFNHENHHASGRDGFLGKVNERYNSANWLDFPFRLATVIKNGLRYIFKRKRGQCIARYRCHWMGLSIYFKACSKKFFCTYSLPLKNLRT